MWDPYSEFQSEALPNGLTIHSAYWSGRPWEAIKFIVHSGAKNDPEGLEGLSHFVEHMVSVNAILPKKEMIAFFENCGGIIDLGSTNYLYTDYGFFAPTDKNILAKAFLIFGHMLMSSKLEKFVDNERKIIIGEFRRHYPFKFKFDLEMQERKDLYAGYWLERFARPLGAPESIEQISSDDLQLYYDTHYTPSNISIVGVGGLTLSELTDLISISPFAVNKKGTRSPILNPVTNINHPLETRCVIEISKHIKTKVPVEFCAYRSVAKIPGNISEQATQILRGMFNKTLTEEVREQHAWTYSIKSLRNNFGIFHEFSINCDSLSLEGIDKIEETINTIIGCMTNDKVLFEQTKQRTLADSCMIDISGKGLCNNIADELGINQRIISIKEYQNNIKKLTMEDMTNLLQWLQPEWRRTTIVKP